MTFFLSFFYIIFYIPYMYNDHSWCPFLMTIFSLPKKNLVCDGLQRNTNTSTQTQCLDAREETKATNLAVIAPCPSTTSTLADIYG